jgi:hypothetical protein
MQRARTTRYEAYLGVLLLGSLATGVACAPRSEGAPPSDALTLRELLAMSPDAVRAMPAAERSWWRHRVDEVLAAQADAGEVRPAAPGVVPAAPGVALALPGALKLALAVDAGRDGQGLDPLVAVAAQEGALSPLPALSLFEDGDDDAEEGGAGGGVADAEAHLGVHLGAEMDGASSLEGGSALSAPALRAALDAVAALRGLRRALASAAPPDAEVALRPAPAAPFALLYSPDDGVAWVNPVLLALRDDDAYDALTAPGALVPGGARTLTPAPRYGRAAWWGNRNPYNFYESIAACAAAEANRCGACMPAGTCEEKLGSGDGNTECAVLSTTANGYELACLMYAYSMSTVEFCMDDAAPACRPADLRVALDNLESFRPVFNDPACMASIDQCVAPYRSELSCGDPCGDFCNGLVDACTQPCTSGIDACSSTSSACGETCTGCGNTTSSTAGSCGDACSSGADSCGSACDSSSSSCSCAVARSLPEAPLDPARATSPGRGPRVAAAARNVLFGLLPPVVMLLWRRRLARREVRT